jgi:hypothetical protein
MTETDSTILLENGAVSIIFSRPRASHTTTRCCHGGIAWIETTNMIRYSI